MLVEQAPDGQQRPDTHLAVDDLGRLQHRHRPQPPADRLARAGDFVQQVFAGVLAELRQDEARQRGVGGAEPSDEEGIWSAARTRTNTIGRSSPPSARARKAAITLSSAAATSESGIASSRHRTMEVTPDPAGRARRGQAGDGFRAVEGRPESRREQGRVAVVGHLAGARWNSSRDLCGRGTRSGARDQPALSRFRDGRWQAAGAAAPMRRLTTSSARITCGPASTEAPSVGGVEFAVPVHIPDFTIDGEVAPARVVQKRDGAHAGSPGLLVETHLDRGAGLRGQRDYAVGLVEAGDALVDEREDEQTPDVADVGEVDEEVLALGGRAGAVVLVEHHERRPVEGPEGVSQGLDDALAPIGELVQAGEVEVDRAAAGRHHPGEQPALGRWRALVPV